MRYRASAGELLQLEDCVESTELRGINDTHEDQAAVGSDPRSLELDLQRRVERELEGLVLGVTQWVRTSPASSSRANPHP